MSNITQGMNIEEVRRLGADLEAYATKVEAMIRRVERSVTAVTWEGPDARAFKNDWWPGHRTRLDNIVKDLRGFGQSAKNNAEEQERASGVKGGGTSSGGTSGGGGGTGGSSGGGNGGSGAPGFPRANVPIGTQRSWQEVQAAYDRDYVNKYGLWADGGPNGENRYQCVSWAWYRMRELGYKGPQVQGWGGAMAGNMGGSTATVPAPGAVMSYGSHVVIAEDVVRQPDGSLHIRVSEMNVDGDWQHGTPGEYRDNRVMIRNADGSWQGGSPVTVFNPNYS